VAVLRGIVAQPLAAKLIEDRIDDEETEASILDVLPFRLPAARRRWDPFYLTEHQVVALVDNIVIDKQGFAFDATDLVLDKEPVPVNHVVIRDKLLSGNRINALRYRVADFTRITDDLEATAPGRDRMAFSRSDPDNEPTLVDLTLEQIAERIDAERILAPITYTPERIHLVNNQIDHMLTISRRERGEAERRLINRFRNEQREILLNVFSALEQTIREELENELGRPPTDEEVEEAIDAFLDPALDSLQTLFEKSDLPPLLEEEVLRNLRLELAPEQYVTLQNAGILIIDGKEIIIRRNKDGTTTPYFRDHPDADPRDNLLSLPTYSPPFVAAD
jgi:AcrR family transcriptional regulator